MNGKSPNWLKFLKINSVGQVKSACGPDELGAVVSARSWLELADILLGCGTVIDHPGEEGILERTESSPDPSGMSLGGWRG